MYGFTIDVSQVYQSSCLPRSLSIETSMDMTLTRYVNCLNAIISLPSMVILGRLYLTFKLAEM